MAKKAAPKPTKKAAKGPTAQGHRERAAHYRAQARLHEAKADIMDVKNPPKGGNKLSCY